MKQIKVVAVVGTGHCGSTLLSLLLAGHSSVLSAGEFHSILDKDVLCSNGAPPNADDVWGTVYEQLKGGRLRVHQSKTDFILGQKKYLDIHKKVIDVRAWQNHYVKAMQIALKNAQKNIFMFSGSPAEAELLSYDSRVDLTIIHLVRDGRAVTWSYTRKYGHAVRQMLRWGFVNIKIEIIKRRIRAEMLEVNYDKLASAPESNLRDICESVGVAFQPEMLNFRENAHRTIGGNRMRFNKQQNITPDHSWREYLGFSDRLLFNLFFGWLNLYYWLKIP